MLDEIKAFSNGVRVLFDTDLSELCYYVTEPCRSRFWRGGTSRIVKEFDMFHEAEALKYAAEQDALLGNA